jgi:hypothetical protein
MKKYAALFLLLATVSQAQISFAPGFIPFSSAPTTDALGRLRFDTDAYGANRGALQIFDGTASTWVVAALASDTPVNGNVPTWNTGGTITWEAPGAGSVLWNGVGDADGNNSVALAGFTTIFTSTLDNGIVYEISNTDADAANATTLLKLSHDDGADADVTYLSLIGDKDGTPTSDYLFTQSRLTATKPFTTTDYTSTGQTYYINSGQTVFWKAGTGSPEAAVTGGIGSIWSATDGSAGTTLWVKESGVGNTGWTAVVDPNTLIGTALQAWDTDLDDFATLTAPTTDVVGISDAQTISNKILTDNQYEVDKHGGASVGATETIDVTVPRHEIILGENTTLTLSGWQAGTNETSTTVKVIQDGTGGWTIAYAAGSEPTAVPAYSLTAGEATYIVFLTTTAGTTIEAFSSQLAEPDIPAEIARVGGDTYSGAHDFTGATLTVAAEAYDEAGWNSDASAPTKNDVRDKIEALVAGSATAYDDIGDPDANSTIAFAGFTNLWTSTLDNGNAFEISDTDADAASNTTVLKLSHNDGTDPQVNYLEMTGDKDGTPTTDFIFNQVTGFNSLLPIVPPSEAYDATGWNSDTGAPQKDAVRDKIEALVTGSFGITVDGAGTALTTGSKGYVVVPFGCTITGWSLVADAAGDIEFDVEKAADQTVPSVSIVAAAPPTLSADQIERSTTLTGWTTSVTANDVIEFEVTGTPATITRATLQIHYTR